jgi:type III secretory pathway component EscT
VIEAAIEALFGGAPASRVLPVFALVLARSLPLALAAPWLGWRGSSAIVRGAIALALALALTPTALFAAPELPSGWAPFALMACREAAIGAAFAVASSLVLVALGWSGDLIDRLRGSQEEVGPIGTLHLAAGVVLFVLVGGHRLALSAFAEGLVEAPVGTGVTGTDLSAFALGTMRIGAITLELAASFALPAAVAFAIVELALGFASRAAPRLSVWLAAVPLRAALGVAVALLALSALLPRLPPLFADSIEAARRLVPAL